MWIHVEVSVETAASVRSRARASIRPPEDDARGVTEARDRGGRRITAFPVVVVVRRPSSVADEDDVADEERRCGRVGNLAVDDGVETGVGCASGAANDGAGRGVGARATERAGRVDGGGWIGGARARARGGEGVH
jgi:hypothetical protein